MAHKIALAEDLPATTGVYLMRDAQGRVVHVGCAPNIRRRVRGYFASGKRHGRLIERAVEAADRVDHEETGSEFEAQLRAHRLITELAPTCNRPAVGSRSRRYLRLSAAGDDVRITAVARASRAGEHFGPLAAERTALLASDALQVLLPLSCADGGPPAACRRVLGDDPIASAEETAVLIDRAARAGVLDDGAYTAEIDALVGVIAEIAALARARDARCVLVEDGTQAGQVVAFVVRDGLVVARVEVHAGSEAGAAHRILAALGAPRTQEPLPPEALEEIALVRRRVASRSGHPALIPAPSHTGALVDALRRAAQSLLLVETDAEAGIATAA